MTLKLSTDRARSDGPTFVGLLIGGSSLISLSLSLFLSLSLSLSDLDGWMDGWIKRRSYHLSNL